MNEPRHTHGQIAWHDLTVPDAGAVKEFYTEVLGWTAEPVAMPGYQDYTMADAGGAAVAGVCHARGDNARLPPQWLMYVTVLDLDQALERCQARGGVVIDGPRGDADRFAVIRDPAGAHLALYQKASSG